MIGPAWEAQFTNKEQVQTVLLDTLYMLHNPRKQLKQSGNLLMGHPVYPKFARVISQLSSREITRPNLNLRTFYVTELNSGPGDWLLQGSVQRGHFTRKQRWCEWEAAYEESLRRAASSMNEAELAAVS